jgi:hypothetical protein
MERCHACVVCRLFLTDGVNVNGLKGEAPGVTDG